MTIHVKISGITINIFIKIKCLYNLLFVNFQLDFSIDLSMWGPTLQYGMVARRINIHIIFFFFVTL